MEQVSLQNVACPCILAKLETLAADIDIRKETCMSCELVVNHENLPKYHVISIDGRPIQLLKRGL